MPPPKYPPKKKYPPRGKRSGNPTQRPPTKTFPPRIPAAAPQGPPKGTGGKGGNKPPPGLTVAQQAAKEAQMYIDMMMAQIQAEQDAYQKEIDRQVRLAQERAIALARAIEAMGMPAAISNLFQNAAQSQAGLAGGFSQELQGSAAEQAAQMNNMLAGTGQTARNEGAAMGDVLYGTGGFIPGQTFAESGAGYAANAALQPSFAIRQGAADAAKILAESQDEIGQFSAERAKARAQYPTYYQEALTRAQQTRANLKDEVYKLYQAGLITKREMGRRLGIPGWRKMPNTYADAAEAAAPITKEIGGYLYQYNPKNGRWIPVAGQGEAPKTISQGGYIWQQDPKTGKWVPVGGTGPKPDKPNEPSPYQHVEVGGKTYVFDPNTGVFYDPKTGKPTIPKGSPKGKGKSKFTPLQVQNFKGDSHSIASAAYDGIPDEDLPPLTYQQAIQEAMKAGIPMSIFIPILNRYYKPGERGRPKKPLPPLNPDLRDYEDAPGRGGGQPSPPKNVSFVQEAGFSGDPQVIQIIIDEARRNGLDPYAVLAVALSEGGLRYGAVGDNGDSHGPFQLNKNGALGNRSPAWANSPAGLRWAIRMMARVGARGLFGRDAIEVIINRFERPRYSYLDKAWGYYNQLYGATQVV